MNYPYPGFSLTENYLEKNLKYREDIIVKGNYDEDFRSLLVKMSEEDICFFVNSFVYTYNPRLDVPHIPFITFPFQDECLRNIVNHIEKGEDVLIDKSRDMGVTWMILIAFAWGWLFKGWTLKVGSRKLDYVDRGGDMDSLFEKIRYIIERLPKFFIPEQFSMKRGTKFNSSCRIIHPVNKNAITGEATNPNFARGGRSKAIFYDEFAFWDCAEDAWRGGADTTNCRILVSTPYGKANKFAQIRFDPNIKINKYSYHWSLHPLKTEDWYIEECSRRTELEIAQELDISYDASMTERVYEEFDKAIIGEGEGFDYNPMLPLFYGWDFGEGGPDPTVFFAAQYDVETNCLSVIDEYEGKKQDIDYFATVNNCAFDSKYHYDNEAMISMDLRSGWKEGIHIGDPYNGSKTTFVGGGTSIQNQLRNHGIYINLNRGANSTQERIRITKIFLRNIKVSKRCVKFIESIQNSRWPKKSNTNSTTASKKPVHDKFCLHGDTMIRTLSGYTKIKELEGKDFYVWSYSYEEKRLVPAKAKKCWKSAIDAELVEVKLDDGKTIKCTPNHRFMLRDGSYKEASSLVYGDSLMPMYEKDDAGWKKVFLNDGSIATEHRYVYSRFVGELKDGCHIHHVDGNKENNIPSNLEQISVAEHCKIGKPHLGRTSTTEKLRQETLKKNFITKTCLICNEEFSGYLHQVYCSEDCKNKANSANRVIKKRFEKQCVWCGRQYLGHSRSLCCSLKCSKERTKEYYKIYNSEKDKKEMCMSDFVKFNHKVISVKYIEERADVYDIEVEKYNNFVASGVVLHNSHFRTALEYLCEYLSGYKGKTANKSKFYQKTSFNTGFKDRYKNFLKR